MEIKRVGCQPSGRGPDEYFIGTARVDPLFQAHGPARAAQRKASVMSAPVRRTARRCTRSCPAATVMKEII
jgi:hypothetical protein